MQNPNFDEPFILQTDASHIGVGAVLSQGTSEEQPIAYFSRKLLSQEKKYSTTEKECLAMFLGIKAFEIYMLGRQFIIQTDHRALTWLNKFKDKNPRLTRWSLMLQSYNFIVQHRKGQENGNADGLSRMPLNGDLCFAPGEEERNVTGAD